MYINLEWVVTAVFPENAVDAAKLTAHDGQEYYIQDDELIEAVFLQLNNQKQMQLRRPIRMKAKRKN